MYNDIFGYIRLSERIVEGMDYYHQGLELVDQYITELEQGRQPRELIAKAKDLHRKASEKLFWTGGVWAEFGRAHFYDEEFSEAKKYIKKAIRMQFMSPNTYGIMANIAYNEGEKEEQLLYARKGLELLDASKSERDDAKRIRQKLEWFAQEAVTGENASPS